MVDLSIIIISYNTAEITKQCIESTVSSLCESSGVIGNKVIGKLRNEKIGKLGNKVSFEIIVIDNNSTDGSVEMLQKLKTENFKLKIIANTDNVGFAKANNQAVKLAEGKYILFLNSDTVVLDSAIDKLLTYYKQNEQTVQFLGGKLLNKDMTPQPSCGPFYSLPVVFGALFLRGDYWGLTRSSPDKTIKTDWVSGACILTTKVYYDKLGGFDEKIFMYMDEIDLLYRAKKLGFQTWFYPESQFIHLGSASSGGKTFPILQVYRGFLYFYQKHHSGLPVILLKFLLQLKAVISLIIGRVTRSSYLVKTYEEAFKIVGMD